MPDSLFPAQEPFGVHENNPDGICETVKKTGSMVAAFINAAYPVLKTPIVGVSCSKGGSSINEWMPGTSFYKDALERLRKCREYLLSHHYSIKGIYMAWCQGCTDGDNGMPKDEYRRKAGAFIRSFLKDGGVDRCFLIQIGNHRDDPAPYKPIQDAQEDLCADNKKIVMVSRTFKACAARGLMKDSFHYLQPAYNEVGAESGVNAAAFLNKAALPVDKGTSAD